MSLIVDVFMTRNDNYGYLVHDSETGKTAAIDAPEAGPIKQALTARGWTLSDLLITHHHQDHVEAIPALVEEFGVRVTGPKAEAEKIERLDVLVEPGDTVQLGATRLMVYGTPGHTLGHIVYHDPAGRHLFTADALFSMGVGRMFEGTPGPMWEGLRALRDLPDDTLIYCGHEYSLSNARFALSVDPDNPALKVRAAEVEKAHEAGRFTIPVTLEMEKRTNPFLRADTPEMARAMGLPASDPVAVFAALRKAKDNF
ncbi:MAG TPA: hydroxyacylglutathione hydrolase [Devosiaceae bacterium]|jgi:hydroxyacylglutathione hydrolase|nr:hydroxyacylglutathione hydrolase [Devosiaceae bacterium]